VSLHDWIVFASFWAVFVTSPGPNAVNCISNGMGLGFRRALPGIAGILTQAALFLTLSAVGIAGLIAARPDLVLGLKLAGALVLIGLGLRSWLRAAQPITVPFGGAHGVYLRAFLIATINAKSLAGYLAAFTQFVRPDLPIWPQMAVIYPTALTLTTLSYLGYTGIGTLLGRSALDAVFHLAFRRALAGVFILYGLALGASALQASAS